MNYECDSIKYMEWLESYKTFNLKRTTFTSLLPKMLYLIYEKNNVSDEV